MSEDILTADERREIVRQMRKELAAQQLQAEVLVVVNRSNPQASPKALRERAEALAQGLRDLDAEYGALLKDASEPSEAGA